MSSITELLPPVTLGHPAGQPPQWQTGFAELGPAFYTALRPQPLPGVHWVAHNPALAQSLGMDEAWMASPQALDVFSGNQVAPGSQPLASVYSGHQFGVWAGQLGDGRALLLGEVATADGPQEIQLKGAGRTPYSRMGDGRAVLRSSIREFLCSEAMHALGIPTTRALCLTGSPAPVRRETVESAAVVTRVAPSFIRFGHFEHFAHHGLHTELRQLADFAIARYYPECADTPQPYAALLQAVSERTAHLLAQWQAVGFCHGVMNTDNMSILGLTIDYGPFQFLDGFDPGHICNHSDHQGRYAYQRQPQVAYWNLFCLGQALLPLMADTDQALQALESYKTVFPRALHQRLCDKLGLEAASTATDLPQTLMDALARERVDHTIFWTRLTRSSALPDSATRWDAVRELFFDASAIGPWLERYTQALRTVPVPQAALDRMRRHNPRVVLRNHLAQNAIERAQEGDFQEVQRLLQRLQNPFDTAPFDTRPAVTAADPREADADSGFPPDWAASIEISCSS